ncbi:MAG: hypothetical protein Q8K91_04820 [Hylemonella sp.]|nr:hypothetical protein [Hylemonella sp.]MDP1936512.1 hypothetical protein [Hylemonella sp.]
MKYALIIPLVATLFVANGYAQGRIYRCGNEYTNTIPESQKGRCKLLDGGNVTVVQNQRPAPLRVASAAQAGSRIDTPEQRSRDSDARLILESELRKAELRREELLKDYNNGEPEKLGPETRNHQKYLDRVAELKANIERNDSDIAGIRRELGRVSPPTASK